MASGLIVPIHVAAACAGALGGTDAVQLGMADFSQLAYFADDNYDYPEPSAPYTSGECLQEKTGYLSSGVHLHWKLPDAATAGEQKTEDTPAEFPRIPNRWLVTRMIVNGKTLVSSAAWVVESDRLSERNPLPVVQLPPATTVPVYAEDAVDFGDEGVHVGGLQPFRYLGARNDAKTWRESVNSRAGEAIEYLAEPREYQKPVSRQAASRGITRTAGVVTPYGLTVAGFGDATFASFYPNCASVFGFFDSAAALQSAGYTTGMQLSYHVVGWYSKPKDDAATQSPFRFAPPQATGSTTAYEEAVQDLEESGLMLGDNEKGCYHATAKWFFRSNALQMPVFGLYSGMVAPFSYNPQKAYPLSPGLKQNGQIVIGNTTSEAVAALFAARLSRNGETDLEQQLNALQLGALDALAEPGGIDKTRRALHRSLFASKPGGTQWTIVLQQAGLAGQNPIPEPLAAKLAALNAEQWKHDEIIEESNSIRQQLMADWQKYLYLKRKPYDRMPPNSVPQKWQGQNGAAQIQALLETQLKRLAAVDAEAKKTRANADRLLAEVRSGLAPLSQFYELETGASPEYWGASELAVLLSGPAVKLGEHGKEDGRLRADDYLEVRTKAEPSVVGAGKPPECPFTDQALARTNATEIVREINELLRESFQVATGYLPVSRIPSHQIAVNREVNEWQPLMMLWEVTYRPQASTASAYPPTLLTQGFQIDAQSGDLVALNDPASKVDYKYAGSVPLSAGAPVSLESQIEVCLEYVDDPVEKAKLEALQAELGKVNMLSQSLGGLNAALLMRVQKYQLPVCDTLFGLESELYFSNRMRAAIGRQGDLGENSAAPYSPIRAGLMHLSRLTVVDCFGRRLDLDLTKQLVSRSLRAPTGTLQAFNWFRVPPRLAAPSRLLFRWGAATTGGASPVCGWVMFNLFDNSLLVYAPSGALLGAVQLVDREGVRNVLWQGAPGTASWGQGVVQALAGQSLHLQNFVTGLLASSAYAQAFMHTVDRALALSPNNVGPDANSSILLSKPLGLVRASVKWDLEGLPPVDQSWELLRAAAEPPNSPRYTASVENVRLPVRLGTFSDPSDGLVGFFLDGSKAFYSHASKSSEIAVPKDDTLTLTCNPSDEKHATLLINPYGRVHVSTGVLPVTQLSLAPELYEDALQELKATFLVAPVISKETAMADPKAPVQTIVMALPLPVPDETLEHGEWTWLEQPNLSWRRIGVTKPDGQGIATYNPQTVREGWLTLKHTKPSNGS